MTDRGVSTVLDVCACLLLVSAAVGTLVGAPAASPDPAAGSAGELATTLAASTATVSYGTDRTAHGTHAGLLASAARSNRTQATGERFREAVRSATRGLLAGDGWRARVVATWRPYEGADATGVVAVGSTPPPGVDTHAATTTVASGLRPVGRQAREAAARAGFRGVAAVLADAVIPAASERRREAYVRRAAADLERRYDSPQEAARSVSVGRARVTVRTWSP